MHAEDRVLVVVGWRTVAQVVPERGVVEVPPMCIGLLHSTQGISDAVPSMHARCIQIMAQRPYNDRIAQPPDALACFQRCCARVHRFVHAGTHARTCVRSIVSTRVCARDHECELTQHKALQADEH